MRWLIPIPFFFLIYGGICFYIGRKLLCFIRCFLPKTMTAAFWIPFALLCCAIILANLFRHNIPLLRQAGLFWMTVFPYMLMCLVLSDAVRLALFLLGKKLPNFNMYSIGAALLLCAILIIYGLLHVRSIYTVNYRITLSGSGSPIRVVLVSDLHIGFSVGEAWVKRVADKINIEKPDMVFIAGDIFDGNLDVIRNLPGVITQLKRINAPLGVYACLGNHDTDRMSFTGGRTERIAEILRETDIVLLQDEARAVRPNLYVAGRRDARPIGMNAHRKTPAELLAGLDGTIIVLDHQPTQYPQLEKAGANLVFSGHTHRGQLFPANLITWRIYKSAGAVHYGYWKGGSMQAVVTSGAGFWGPPLRIATNSEVAVIDIEFVP